MESAAGSRTESHEDPAMHRLLGFLSQRTGLCLSDERNPALRESVQRAMKQAAVVDLDEFRARVELDRAAFDDLIAEVTVGETYFYREPQQFQTLRNTILPEIRSRKGPDHAVRFWSAGCSTGEEAWSLAMLCEQAGLPDTFHILATDISRESLRKAERGVYRNWSLRGPSREFAGIHLHETSEGWHIDDALRRNVVFDCLNLSLDNYPSMALGTWGLDIIFCRNVLIYFDQQTVEAVARRLFNALSPGGWLILASTDPPVTAMAPFELVETGGSLAYRRPVSTEPGTSGELPPIPKSEQPFEEPESQPVDSTVVRNADLNLQEARNAFQRGDFVRVRELTEGRKGSVIASALLVRALTSLDLPEAERECAAAAGRHATSEELHFLHAALLLELNRYDDAARAARRALFLDRNLAIAHFTLGVIQQRAGLFREAIHSFRNAKQICDRQPPHAIVPFSDGEYAGSLSQLAMQHLTLLEANSRPE